MIVGHDLIAAPEVARHPAADTVQAVGHKPSTLNDEDLNGLNVLSIRIHGAVGGPPTSSRQFLEALEVLGIWIRS